MLSTSFCRDLFILSSTHLSQTYNMIMIFFQSYLLLHHQQPLYHQLQRDKPPRNKPSRLHHSVKSSVTKNITSIRTAAKPCPKSPVQNVLDSVTVKQRPTSIDWKQWPTVNVVSRSVTADLKSSWNARTGNQNHINTTFSRRVDVMDVQRTLSAVISILKHMTNINCENNAEKNQTLW